MAVEPLKEASVVILGAGVTGLTVGWRLLRDPQFVVKKLVFIADDFPDDEITPASYASTRAGAHWRAIATDDSSQERLRHYETFTYNEWNRVVNEVGNGQGYGEYPNTTVESIWSYDYYDEKPNLPLWWANVVKSFEELPKDELPEGVAYGVKYKTFVINSPEYIKYLLQSIKKMAHRHRISIELIRKSITSIEDDVMSSRSFEGHLVVNCMGLGNLKVSDVGDTKCHPSRGQVLLANAPQVKRTSTRISADGLSYVIPRPRGHCILGGSHWLNCWLETPDEQLTETIKRKTSIIVPELGAPEDIQVDQVSVGFRPCRLGGPRIEVDPVNDRLIHAYGVAGAGFQMSHGVAEEVFDLIKKVRI